MPIGLPRSFSPTVSTDTLSSHKSISDIGDDAIQGCVKLM